MTALRTAAQQALEYMKSVGGIDMYPEEWAIVERLEAALAEEALQRLTDVQQEMERNFCPRCGKRTNDIHTCTPPQAEPVQEPVAWMHVPHPDNGLRPVVSLSQQREPSLYGASVPLFIKEQL